MNFLQGVGLDPALWPAFALVASLGLAAMLRQGEDPRVTAEQLLLWRCLGMGVLLAPGALLVPWPRDPRFYALVVGVGLLVSRGDRAIFAGAARFGAGAVSRLVPLSLLGSFALWLIVDPAERIALGAEPWRLIAMLGLLALVVAGAMALRRDPISAQALLWILPILVVFALIDVGNKLSLGLGVQAVPLAAAVLLYVWIGGLVAAAAIGLELWLRPPPWPWASLLSAPVRRRGARLVAIMVLLISTRTVAIALAPNPAYAGAVMQAGILWLLMLDWAAGRPLPGRALAAGLLIAAAATGIALLRPGA